MRADDALVGMTVLDGCYKRLGWFTRAPLYWTRYESGCEAIVYPIYPGPVYVSVVESRPDLLRDPVEVARG